jgi:two-component system nitrogen regulation sensor histidine kinase NtrY
MATSVREVPRPRLPARPAVSRGTPAERRPFRDNPRLILLGIAVLLAALVAMVTLADRSAELNPDFLTEVVLYALSAADLTMLLALVFVLARNVVKLAVERRRGLPFSRFRAKLVMALLGLTIVPSVLVLIVGGELIRSSTQRWVSQPMDDVLRAAKQIAGDYYSERETVVLNHASRIARDLPIDALRAADTDALRAAIEVEVTQGRVGLVEVYGVGTRRIVWPRRWLPDPAPPRTNRWTAAASCCAPGRSSAIRPPGGRWAWSSPAIIWRGSSRPTRAGSFPPTRTTRG